MKIASNAVVSIHYTLKNAEGEVLDSSEGANPLNYLHGAGNIIPGLEKSLEGKLTGDELTAVVSPEEGYGVRDDALMQSVPRSAFGDVSNIEVGMRFTAETDQGPVSMAVAAVDKENVVVDRNHPLAGMELHFAVSVASVRSATAEEIEHGHVHEAGECH